MIRAWLLLEFEGLGIGQARSDGRCTPTVELRLDPADRMSARP